MSITISMSIFPGPKKDKLQRYTEIVNYQQSETIDLESKKVWLTDVFSARFFNQYVRDEIRSHFLKRVIINGLNESSWRFMRFDRLTIIVTGTDTFKSNTF